MQAASQDAFRLAITGFQWIAAAGAWSSQAGVEGRSNRLQLRRGLCRARQEGGQSLVKLVPARGRPLARALIIVTYDDLQASSRDRCRLSKRRDVSTSPGAAETEVEVARLPSHWTL